MSALDELVGELARLPGIGRKTALRLAFHILKSPAEESSRLSRAIQVVRERVRECEECGNLTEQSPCDICTSVRRDASTLCVVEEASDILAIEPATSTAEPCCHPWMPCSDETAVSSARLEEGRHPGRARRRDGNARGRAVHARSHQL